MDANSQPIDFQTELGRRLLKEIIIAGEEQSLGSLAADLDLMPPEALKLLHRLVVQDGLPIRAELNLSCPDCGLDLGHMLGLAAWVMAGQAFEVPCVCGQLAAVAPSYPDLILKPDTVQPHSESGDEETGRSKRIAEAARQRGKTLDQDSLNALQLSFFDWGLFTEPEE